MFARSWARNSGHAITTPAAWRSMRTNRPAWRDYTRSETSYRTCIKLRWLRGMPPLQPRTFTTACRATFDEIAASFQNVRSCTARSKFWGQPLQRNDGRAAVQQAPLEQADRVGDGMA